MSPFDTFQAALLAAYRDRFVTDPKFAFVATRTTPERLAAEMTAALRDDTAHYTGAATRQACSTVGIKPTPAAIRAYLRETR